MQLYSNRYERMEMPVFEPTAYRSPWMTEDLDALRAHSRAFLDKEATPNLERWAEQGSVDREFWNSAGDAGLLCISIPDRKSTRLNSSHVSISYAVFCLKKKINYLQRTRISIN